MPERELLQARYNNADMSQRQRYISHDIRAQLTNILGDVALLRRALENKLPIGKDEQLVMLDEIEQAAQAIDLIVDATLKL